VKKPKTSSELAAGRAARRQGLLMGALAMLIGAVLLLFSGAFFALHCILMICVAIAAGMAATRAAAQFDSAKNSLSAAAAIGGVYACLGFALAFVVYFLSRWATIDDAEVARRIAALTPTELAQLQQFNIVPGSEFFTSQDLSYVAGYLLFAVLWGWIFGSVGGALSQRRS
jgi:hypothetical protein